MKEKITYARQHVDLIEQFAAARLESILLHYGLHSGIRCAPPEKSSDGYTACVYSSKCEAPP